MNNVATFAGGCFWCTEHDLHALPGVVAATSGYTHSALDGASDFAPTYQNHIGFREAVRIEYSDEITFKKLCQFFLDSIDPTDGGGQFHDRGESYKTAIYFSNDAEQKIAHGLIQELSDSKIFDKEICVDVLPAGEFFTAEDYHQKYSELNPEHYMNYRIGSGREAFVQTTCRLRNNIPWKD
jgi:peptide methionine sulfoxide reductase msrA/msrB